jgi:beta-N-acetylhexosaminidase
LAVHRLAVVVLALVLTTPAQSQTLSLEQRVAQLFMVTLHGSQLTEVGRDFLQQWQPGAVVLFSSNVGTPEAVTTLTNAYQQTMYDVNAVPVLIAVDQEGGVVQRLTDGFTQWPTPMVIGAADDPLIAQSVGAAVAGELRAVGINMNLAPVADLETYRENPIIFRRAFGSDPQMVGAAVSGVVQGLQENGVLATLKHFPGHGETRVDSHAELPVIALDRARLETVEIEPFRQAIDAGVEAVLVAHIWYPAFDGDEELPASLSQNLISGVLRGELGFDGLVLTDAIDMNAIDMEFGLDDAVIRAIKAGVDIIAPGPSIGLDTQAHLIQVVVDAVRGGEIAEARIDESVQRILDAKARYGLFAWQPLDAASASERVSAVNGAAVVENLFRAGVTVALDRNDLLPVSETGSVAVIFLATRYQIVDECSRYRSDIRWVGVGDEPSDDEIAWAVEAANQSDIAVVFTQNAIDNLRQQALVNALPPEKTAAVALFSPYDWTTFPEIAGYVTTYSPMRPAVPAACAVLFGAAPALGRLPITLEPGLVAGSRAD